RRLRHRPALQRPDRRDEGGGRRGRAAGRRRPRARRGGAGPAATAQAVRRRGRPGPLLRRPEGPAGGRRRTGGGRMSEGFQPNLDFTAADAAAEEGEAFVVDLEGYEGPLHVLLALARTQKVDLLKLSITKLAEQYLAFVHEARRRNFSLAADYLVMASWLAYLKSRLLLPRTEQKGKDEVPAEQMAAFLAFRLQKLEAMRKAADQLMERPQLKRDVFTRGEDRKSVV